MSIKYSGALRNGSLNTAGRLEVDLGLAEEHAPALPLLAHLGLGRADELAHAPLVELLQVVLLLRELPRLLVLRAERAPRRVEPRLRSKLR